jgi:uncharacterized protein (UPF0332 family)
MAIASVLSSASQADRGTRGNHLVTNDPLRDLILYRLDRAQESLEEALLMQREEHWNACANRLYYSCFYAVSALLASAKLASPKHSGVKSLFDRHFVKTGKVSKEDGRLYNKLFEARLEGDYVDYVVFDQATVKPWIAKVRGFVETVSRLLEQGS